MIQHLLENPFLTHLAVIVAGEHLYPDPSTFLLARPPVPEAMKIQTTIELKHQTEAKAVVKMVSLVIANATATMTTTTTWRVVMGLDQASTVVEED